MARGPRSSDKDVTTRNADRPGARKDYGVDYPKPPNRGSSTYHNPEPYDKPAPKRGPNTPLDRPEPYAYRGGRKGHPLTSGDLADMISKSRPKPRGAQAAPVVTSAPPRIPVIKPAGTSGMTGGVAPPSTPGIRSIQRPGVTGIKSPRKPTSKMSARMMSL